MEAVSVKKQSVYAVYEFLTGNFCDIYLGLVPLEISCAKCKKIEVKVKLYCEKWIEQGVKIF